MDKGMVDQIPDPGDFVKYDIVHESIICVRGEDHKIRAFYNACQHRGNQLVTAEVGTLAGGEFQCAYHGWRFDTTGECTWAYDEDDFPQGSPCGKLNLVEIPCETRAKPIRDYYKLKTSQNDINLEISQLINQRDASL